MKKRLALGIALSLMLTLVFSLHVMAASTTFYIGSDTGTVTANFNSSATNKTEAGLTYSNAGPTIKIVNDSAFRISGSEATRTMSRSASGTSTVSRSIALSGYYAYSCTATGYVNGTQRATASVSR